MISMWEGADGSENHIAWPRNFFDAMEPFSTGGVYVNFLSEEGVVARIACLPR